MEKKRKKPTTQKPDEMKRNDPLISICTEVSCYVQWWGENFDSKLDETKQPFDFHCTEVSSVYRERNQHKS
jgi:hypothetical protein